MTHAIVLGGAACLWQDLRDLDALLGRPLGGLVLAVNDSGWAYPGRVDHWVSLHPEKFPAWKALREANGYPNGYVTWGGRWRTGVDDSPQVDRVMDVVEVGSSGLHATLIAVTQLGCDRVVLAGTPMDGQQHFARGVPWDMGWWHRKGWEEALPKLQGRVRSISGWTRELLGEVTVGWLNGAEQ